MSNQADTSIRPKTIDELRYAADSAFAMLAGMQLDVFTPLRDGPKTADQIGEAIGVNPDRLKLLLYALVSAGLLDVQNGVFANTAEAAHFLVQGKPEYLGGMHPRLADHWSAKLKTADSLKTGVPQLKLDFSDSSPEELESFVRTINKQNRATGSALVERCDFSSIHTLVDVGGGAGGLATTIANACAHITATIVDLPKVTAIARKVVDEEGLGDRVAIITADVLTGALPGSYDAAVLKNFLQVLSPRDARRALASVSRAIKPGGTVYIVGQVLDDSRTSPPASVGFNLNFINRYETGEAYTEQEHRDWLAAAGFMDVTREKFLLPGEYGLITARKPL